VWSSVESGGKQDPDLASDVSYHSNLYHTGHEVMTHNPCGVGARDMVEANRQTLTFFRVACRQLPQIVHKHNLHMNVNLQKAKLNLAKWLRKNSNMRDPGAISFSLQHGYDFLFNCAYCDIDEAGYIKRYISHPPETREGDYNSDFDGGMGLNMMDRIKFANKSTFMKKFIKGTRPLL